MPQGRALLHYAAWLMLPIWMPVGYANGPVTLTLFPLALIAFA
jgi:hypothetical protein